MALRSISITLTLVAYGCLGLDAGLRHLEPQDIPSSVTLTNSLSDDTETQTPVYVNRLLHFQENELLSPPSVPATQDNVDSCSGDCKPVQPASEPDHAATGTKNEYGKAQDLTGSKKGNFYMSFGGSWDKTFDWVKEGILGWLGGNRPFQQSPMQRTNSVPQSPPQQFQVVDAQPTPTIQGPVYESPLVEFVDVGPLDQPCPVQVDHPCLPVEEMVGAAARQNIYTSPVVLSHSLPAVNFSNANQNNYYFDASPSIPYPNVIPYDQGIRYLPTTQQLQYSSPAPSSSPFLPYVTDVTSNLLAQLIPNPEFSSGHTRKRVQRLARNLVRTLAG